MPSLMPKKSMWSSGIRINPASALPETKEQFETFYGGLAEWDDAQSVANTDSDVDVDKNQNKRPARTVSQCNKRQQQ